MLAIEAENLRKVFPGDVVAVDGIDLAVPEGAIVAFLGPNGAGKSTTARMLTTLLAPTSGWARVAGHDVRKDAHRIRTMTGVALQEAGLDRLATGRELLTLQARLYGMRGRSAPARAGELLHAVGLDDAADRRVATYSGGMKRRLDLASALVHYPRILFLDEPTAGLDPASRFSIWEEVRRLNGEDGVTVFLTTQYLEEADQLAQHVLIIDHGRIVAQGAPDELKAQIGNDVVTVELAPSQRSRARAALRTLRGITDIRDEDGALTLFLSDGSGAVARVVRALDKARVRVRSVGLSKPTLDEVFLRATGARLEGSDAAQQQEEAS